MSDDYTPSFEEMSFDEARGISPDAYDFDKPDINDWMDNVNQDWLDAWDAVPWFSQDDDGQWHDFTSETQIEAFIDLLLDMDPEDWPDWDDPEFDFWEWWEENYG